MEGWDVSLLLSVSLALAAGTAQAKSPTAVTPCDPDSVGVSETSVQLAAEAQKSILAESARVLNSAKTSDENFSKTVDSWPDGVPIWPYLTTRTTRERFIQLIVARDDTNERKYESFKNLCTGFSTQFYARYSSRARVTDDERRRMREVGIDAVSVAPKWKVPLFMATYRGHLFNAFLVDESRPDSLASYAVFEPQTDGFIEPGTASYYRYVERWGMTPIDLKSFTPTQSFLTVDQPTFVTTGSGRVVREADSRMQGFYEDVLIAETGKQNFDYYTRGEGFGPFLRRRIKESWKLSDAQLVTVGSYVVGRGVKSSPDAEPEVATSARFAEWIGRPDLAAKIEEAAAKLR